MVEHMCIKDYVSNNVVPDFTEDNLKMWEMYKKRINISFQKYNKYLYAPYIKCFNKLNISEYKLESFSLLNFTLSKYNWKIVWTPGYIPSHHYCKLISEGFFPLSKLFRNSNQLDYSPTPDFIHDFIGHLPLLLDKEYTKYLKNISKSLVNSPSNELDKNLYATELHLSLLYHNGYQENSKEIIKATKEIDDIYKQLVKKPSLKVLLSRLFLYSIEFGILGSYDNFKIFGAAILSSFDELERATKRKIIFKAYNLEACFDNFDNFSDFQKHLYIAPNVQHYQSVLQEFQRKFLIKS